MVDVARNMFSNVSEVICEWYIFCLFLVSVFMMTQNRSKEKERKYK